MVRQQPQCLPDLVHHARIAWQQRERWQQYVAHQPDPLAQERRRPCVQRACPLALSELFTAIVFQRDDGALARDNRARRSASTTHLLELVAGDARQLGKQDGIAPDVRADRAQHGEEAHDYVVGGGARREVAHDAAGRVHARERRGYRLAVGRRFRPPAHAAERALLKP